jgi:uncharacterized protein
MRYFFAVLLCPCLLVESPLAAALSPLACAPAVAVSLSTSSQMAFADQALSLPVASFAPIYSRGKTWVFQQAAELWRLPYKPLIASFVLTAIGTSIWLGHLTSGISAAFVWWWWPATSFTLPYGLYKFYKAFIYFRGGRRKPLSFSRHRIVAWVFILALWGWPGLRYLEHSRIYNEPRHKILGNPMATYGIPYENIFFKAADNTLLNGWYVPGVSQDPSSVPPVILLFHGNDGNISDTLQKIQLLHQEVGATIFVIDYPGYGISKRWPTESGIHQAAEAALKYLVEQKRISPSNIVIYGHSLGGLIAVALGAEHPELRGVILEAPPTSIPAMAEAEAKEIAEAIANVIPVHIHLPLQHLVIEKYDALRKIGDLHQPKLLIFVINRDEQIPEGMGEQLFDRAPISDKTLVKLEGTHDGAFLKSKESFLAAIRKFLSPKHVSQNGAQLRISA